MNHWTTTGSVLASWALVQPHATAVVDAYTGAQLSYRDLDQHSTALALRLHHAGVGAGDIVAYLLADRLGTVTLLYALGKLGAAWTPLNPHAIAADWLRQLGHSGANTIVYDQPFESAFAHVQRMLPTAVGLPWKSLDGPIGPYRPTPTGAAEDQRAGILYTSGTTGVPKGAWHTHRTLWGWNYSLVQSLGMHRDDRLVNPYPLFHMGGIGFTLAAVQTGATVVLATPFDAAYFVESVHRFGGTLTLMVPTMVQAVLDLPPQFHAVLRRSSLRQLITTSAPLLTETGIDLQRAWPNLHLSVLYSATEAIFTLLRHEQRAAPLCVGRPVCGMQIAILDSEGQTCPVGSVGAIYARGISVFSGYHQAPEPAGWPRGWMTCRDLGYLDADGYLYLVDRETDLINSGGEKISSLEIENILRSHPGVKEVGVIGVPDRYWGERIHAAVVRRDAALTAEQLLLFASERLPAFKVPKSLDFIETLPKTATGKLRKGALRALPMPGAERLSTGSTPGDELL